MRTRMRNNCEEGVLLIPESPNAVYRYIHTSILHLKLNFIPVLVCIYLVHLIELNMCDWQWFHV